MAPAGANLTLSPMTADQVSVTHVSDVDWPWMATVDANATMLAAATLLTELDVGILGVVDDGELVGVVGERDVVRACTMDRDLQSAPVTEFMTKDPVTISTSSDISSAAFKMVAAHVRHLPVVEGTTVVGMVSARDLLAAVTNTNGSAVQPRRSVVSSIRRGPRVRGGR